MSSLITVTDVNTYWAGATSIIVEGITTATSTSYTTIPATPGQTITVFFPPCLVVASIAEPTLTVIANEIDIFLQAPRGNIWTSLTLEATCPTSVPTPVPSTAYTPTPTVYVVGPISSGWDSWSQSEKGGVISGVILFVLLVLGLLWCLQMRRKEWMAQQWGNTNNMQMVHRSSALYYPGWGWRG